MQLLPGLFPTFLTLKVLKSLVLFLENGFFGIKHQSICLGTGWSFHNKNPL